RCRPPTMPHPISFARSWPSGEGTRRSFGRRQPYARRWMFFSQKRPRLRRSPSVCARASIRAACSIPDACGRGSSMQTSFTLAQLADPDVAESEKILRACVHCGFCTATCPTYVLDGNELDSPRGRIYLIKDMLESDRPATAEVTLHIDRCLSCLACMTTCPSGVHYMHLVDHARAHIEKTYRRPAHERLLRAALATLLPYPQRFRLVLTAAPSR